MTKRVEIGCRDCKKCMISGVGRAGRKVGRGMAAFMSGGLSEAAMAFTKDCGQCGHPLSLHEDFQQRTGWKQKQQGTQVGAGSGRPEKVEIRAGSLRFHASPNAVWAAVLDGVDEKAVKKRDATGVKIKLGGALSGVPAVMIEASVEPIPEGPSRLRYNIGGGMLGNASEGAAAASLNGRIREEEARLLRRLASRLGVALEHQEDTAPPRITSEPTVSDAQGANLAGQIAELADLHARGVLTDEEFAAAKARLLG